MSLWPSESGTSEIVAKREGGGAETTAVVLFTLMFMTPESGKSEIVAEWGQNFFGDFLKQESSEVI